jgi:hypothetical protein
VTRSGVLLRVTRPCHVQQRAQAMMRVVREKTVVAHVGPPAYR